MGPAGRAGEGGAKEGLITSLLLRGQQSDEGAVGPPVLGSDLKIF